MVLILGAVAFVVLAATLVPWAWVPGGHAAHIPADKIFTPHQIARATTYSHAQAHLSWIAYGVELAAFLIVGLTPIGGAVMARLRGPRWVRVSIGALLLVLLGTIVQWPFAWRIQRRDLAYGLSHQPWTDWWRDQGISLLVGWVGTAIAMLVLLALIRRAPRRWPALAALAVCVLGVLAAWGYPVVVEPLFNHFTPLHHGRLRSQILTLAHREHVHVSDVLVADASRRTTTLNAYVSGFGDTRRVVLYDTLLRDVPRRQVLAVVAHELGHARRGDVLLGTGLGVAGGVAGVGLLGLLLSSEGLRRRSGVRTTGDATVLPLLMALWVIAGLLASPVENATSRAIEARADRASLYATHDVPAFVAMQQRLAVSSLADPNPPWLAQFWFGTHPTALQRIGIAKALAPRLH